LQAPAFLFLFLPARVRKFPFPPSLSQGKTLSLLRIDSKPRSASSLLRGVFLLLLRDREEMRISSFFLT